MLTISELNRIEIGDTLYLSNKEVIIEQVKLHKIIVSDISKTIHSLDNKDVNLNMKLLKIEYPPMKFSVIKKGKFSYKGDVIKVKSLKEGDQIATCSCLPTFSSSHPTEIGDDETCSFCGYYALFEEVTAHDLNRFKKHEVKWENALKEFDKGYRHRCHVKSDDDGVPIYYRDKRKYK